MSVMTIPEAWYAQDRTLTVEDMENMPDDEFRYELDDGVLIVAPAPTNRHQLAAALVRASGSWSSGSSAVRSSAVPRSA